MSKTFKFHIDCPSELSAGLRGYNDDITLTIDSGDPGGEDGEFEDYMIDCLKEWFDGANVTLIEE